MTLIFQMIMESQIITELVKMMNSISNLEDREKKKVNKKKFQIKIMEVGLVIYLILIFLRVTQQKIKINKTIKHKIKAILICLEDHLILCKKLKTNWIVKMIHLGTLLSNNNNHHSNLNNLKSPKDSNLILLVIILCNSKCKINSNLHLPCLDKEVTIHSSQTLEEDFNNRISVRINFRQDFHNKIKDFKVTLEEVEVLTKINLEHRCHQTIHSAVEVVVSGVEISSKHNNSNIITINMVGLTTISTTMQVEDMVNSNNSKMTFHITNHKIKVNSHLPSKHRLISLIDPLLYSKPFIMR